MGDFEHHIRMVDSHPSATEMKSNLPESLKLQKHTLGCRQSLGAFNGMTLARHARPGAGAKGKHRKVKIASYLLQTSAPKVSAG